jgi:hypothetical protein
MVLFVICVRLPEILYQKTLQPKCPGISGVRQLYQLIPIKVSPFLPIVRSSAFLQAQGLVSGIDTETRGFSRRSANKSIPDVRIKVRVVVVYHLYNKRVENNN